MTILRILGAVIDRRMTDRRLRLISIGCSAFRLKRKVSGVRYVVVQIFLCGMAHVRSLRPCFKQENGYHPASDEVTTDPGPVTRAISLRDISPGSHSFDLQAVRMTEIKTLIGD